MIVDSADASWLALGVPAVSLLVLSLGLRWVGGVPWAIAALGIEYGISLHLRQSPMVDSSTAIIGAALLLVAELSYWSLGSPRGTRSAREVVERRVLLTAALLGGSMVLSLLLVLVTEISAPGGLLWTVLGIVAAVLLVALIAALERRGTG